MTALRASRNSPAFERNIMAAAGGVRLQQRSCYVSFADVVGSPSYAVCLTCRAASGLPLGFDCS